MPKRGCCMEHVYRSLGPQAGGRQGPAGPAGISRPGRGRPGPAAMGGAFLPQAELDRPGSGRPGGVEQVCPGPAAAAARSLCRPYILVRLRNSQAMN